MRRAPDRSLIVCLLASLSATPTVAAAIVDIGPLAVGRTPVQPRREVPDDPLAGLPPENSGKPVHGKGGTGKGHNLCNLDATPANRRDIGDLRAALAFVQRGPRSWPCPRSTAGNGVGLRITIDGTGKVTSVEPTGPESSLASAIAKKLVGRSIAPRPAGSTTGTVLLTFSTGTGR